MDNPILASSNSETNREDRRKMYAGMMTQVAARDVMSWVDIAEMRRAAAETSRLLEQELQFSYALLGTLKGLLTSVQELIQQRIGDANGSPMSNGKDLHEAAAPDEAKP
jgi:hypothetical protein